MYALLIHEIKLKSIALFNTFLLIPLRWKLQLKQRFKRTFILYPIYFSYSHIPIHCNHEIVNVIKIQNSHLKSFFLLDHPFWYCDCEYVLLKKKSFVEFQICNLTKFEGFTQFRKWNLRPKFQVMSMTPCFPNLH